MNFSSTKPRELLPGFLRGGLSWGAVEFFVESARKMGLYKNGLYKMGRKHLSFRQKSLPQIKKGKSKNYCNKNQQVAPLSG